METYSGPVILVEDGAPYHGSAIVKEYVSKQKVDGQLYIYRLPSYSPDYNPIEKLWKTTVVKPTHLRKRRLKPVRWWECKSPTVNRLDEAEKCLWACCICQSHFPVPSFHFQLVTICYRLTYFFFQRFFEFIPIFSGCLIFGLLD